MNFAPPPKREKKKREDEDGKWQKFDSEYGEFSLFVKDSWSDVKLVKVYPYRLLDYTLEKFQVRFSYNYLEEGALVFEGKDIRKYKRRFGENKHTWKDTADVPYRYPDIVAAAKDGRVIYLVEGEKDVDNIVEQWGLEATTVGSVSNTWQTDWCLQLVGTKGIVVVADNDGLTKKKNNGYEGALKNSAIIKAAGLPVKLHMFDNVKDTTDFIELGGTKDEFQAMVKALPLWTPPSYEIPKSVAPPPPKTDEEAKQPIWSRIEYFADTDAANGERFAKFYADTVRFVPQKNAWYLYNGKYWEEDLSRKVKEYGKTIGKRIIASIPDANWDVRTDLQKWAKNTEQMSYVNRMLAAAESLMITHLHEFDSADNNHLFNCEDGIINLQTGDLMPHDPKYLITKISPVKFSKRTPTMWLAHLNRAFNYDQELLSWFQALLGYCLTGYTWFQKYQFWQGPGGTGKSITQDTIFMLAGTYGGALDAVSLMETKVRTAGAEDDIAATKGARIVFAPEVKKSHVLDEEVVKAITGGDVLRVKHMHGSKFNLRGNAKLIFIGNGRMQTGNNDAIQRRFMEIPFLHKLDEKEWIEDYDELMLRTEGDAILGWLTEGARRVLQKEINLYNMPESVKRQITEAQEENKATDICEDFIDNCVTFLNDGRVTCHDVYQAFAKYARESGVKPPPKWAFGRAMLKHGHDNTGWVGNKKAYKDIVLIDP